MMMMMMMMMVVVVVSSYSLTTKLLDTLEMRFDKTSCRPANNQTTNFLPPLCTMQGVAAPTKKRPRSLPSLVHILTVGDGDLSLSLALARAYGAEQVHLTASTILPDAAALHRLYPQSAPRVLAELAGRGVMVRFGVDATQLHRTFGRAAESTDADAGDKGATIATKFDLILFYHPHLGIRKENTDEAAQAQQHERLLAHYLASAATCLTPQGAVHVCLCGTQPTTWRIRKSAERLGMTEIKPGRPTTAAPWHHVMLLPQLQAQPALSDWAADRKFRNGRQGSRHWLGKYGYGHCRTQGELYDGSAGNDTNVQWSVDLLFRPPTQNDGDVVTPWTPAQVADDNKSMVCPICGTQSADRKQHQAHLAAPVTPCDVVLVEKSDKDCEGNTKTLVKAAAVTPTSNNNPPLDKIRLRKYLQQHYQLTKKRATQWITAEKVSVNGQVVTDDLRLIPLDATVQVAETINDEDGSTRDTKASLTAATMPIKIVAHVHEPSSSPSTLIVWKPVGLRTKGQFPGTLETLVAQQQQKDADQQTLKVESLTRLDTGLSGLCLLHAADSCPASHTVHHFTGLVMGELPPIHAERMELLLHVDKQRKWKRKTNDDEQQTYRVQFCVTSTGVVPVGDKGQHVTLSTIQLDVLENLSGIGSLLAYALRKQCDLRIVGDRFSNKEYMVLPRSIRNRLKAKICLGCTAITYHGRKYEYPIPDKWRTDYWMTFLNNA